MQTYRNPIIVSSIYFILGLLWIFGTDLVVFQITNDLVKTLHYQNIKGLLFVFLSTLVLFFLLQKWYRLTKRKNSELKDANVQLKQKNQFIETIISHLPVGIAVHDTTSHKALLINDMFHDLYGWEPEDFDDVQSFLDRIYPQGSLQEKTKHEILDDLGSGDPQRMSWTNVEIVSKNGIIKNVNAKNIPLPEQNLMISTVWDTSELMQAYQQLGLTVEGGKIGLWVLNINTGLTEFNSYYAEMLGYQKSEMESNHLFFYENLHPGDKPKFDKIYHDILDGKVTEFSLELRVRAKNGNYKWIINNGQISKRDKSNQPLEIAGIHLDITPQKEAIEQLAKQRERLIRAQQYGKIGNWSYQIPQDEITWSKSMYPIYDMDEKLGPPDMETITTKFFGPKQAFHNALVERAIKLAEPYDVDLPLTTPAGNKKFIRAIGFPVFNDENKVVGLEGIVQDLTERSLLTQQLQDSKARLEAAITGADLGIWDINLQTGENFTNDRWWEMLGYDVNEREYSVAFFESLLHLDDKRKPFDVIDQIEAGEHNNIDLLLRLKHKKGHFIYVLDRGKAIAFDENGKVTRLIGTHLDMTKSITYQLEIKKAKHQIESIANNLPGAIFTYQYNQNSGQDKVTYVSKGIEKLWGEAPENLMKDSSFIWKRVHSEDVEGLKEAILQSAQSMNRLSHQWRVQHDDGTIKWVEANAEPKKLNKNKIAWDAIIDDITEQINNKLALERAYRERKDILESITDGFISVDQNWMITYWNKAAEETLLISKEKLLGKNLWEANKTHHIIRYRELFDSAKEQKKAHSFEDYYRNINKWLLISVYPKDNGITIFFKDISRQKRYAENILENTLKSQEKERNRIAKELHDGIVQEMAACTLQLNMLIKNARGQKSHLQDVADFLKKITNDTRSISHNLASDDLDRLSIEELIVNLLKRLQSNEKVTFKQNLTLNEANVKMDVYTKTHLFRIIQELINNILKHSGATQAVFNVEELDDTLYINIGDNGKGYDPAVSSEGIGMKNIYERVNAIHGKVDFVNREKGGLLVSLEVPITAYKMPLQ